MRKRDALRILKDIKSGDVIHLETKRVVFYEYHKHFVFYQGLDLAEEGILVSFHRCDTGSRIKIHFNLIKALREASQEDLVLRIRYLRDVFIELKKELEEREYNLISQ